MLPKGALSHDQLSQLLLVYVGTAADIVEFYEAFNEEAVSFSLNHTHFHRKHKIKQACGETLASHSSV